MSHGNILKQIWNLISLWLIFSGIPKGLFWEKDVEICDEWPPKIRMSDLVFYPVALEHVFFCVAVSQSVVWSATDLHDGSLILGLISALAD